MALEMKITRVSISGADDAVDPVDLLRLSVEFPFVEWGILYSEKRQGTPRYPSAEWRENLIGLMLNTVRGKSLHLALHLCGKASRDVFEGKESRWFARKDFHAPYERVQLNGFSPYTEKFKYLPANSDPYDKEELANLFRFCPCEFIIQCADQDELKVVDEFAVKNNLKFLNALFDPSGGRGVESTDWPHLPTKQISVGYAGGINPDNVSKVISGILAKPETDQMEATWIDMESRIRSGEDAFDLKLVREVLTACMKLVGRDK
jgi:N-(5'phosphoribosyl)anthranilate (PRA) isomerase